MILTKGIVKWLVEMINETGEITGVNDTDDGFKRKIDLYGPF